MATLTGKKVAVLATDGFEQSELDVPVEALKKAGATVHILSIKSGSIKAWNKNDWGHTVDVDRTVDQARASDYVGLVLPGGVINPDKLRVDQNAVAFVDQFLTAGRPIAAICHGPWTLVETGKLNGRTMTSYHSIRTDLENAGAKWVDDEVVTDNGLITSRSPQDLPAFCKKMIEEFAEGQHS